VEAGKRNKWKVKEDKVPEVGAKKQGNGRGRGRAHRQGMSKAVVRAHERGRRSKAVAAAGAGAPLATAVEHATPFQTNESLVGLVNDMELLLSEYDAMRTGPGGAARLVWREVSPQHFAHSQGGLFPGMEKSKLQGEWEMKQAFREPCAAHAAEDTSIANVANLALRDTLQRYPWVLQLPIWEMSALRPDAHTSSECTHWCQPGPVSWWIIMLQHLQQAQSPP
jgi:hypothetical protein